MSGNEESLREALSKIAEIASAAAHGTEGGGNSQRRRSRGRPAGRKCPPAASKAVPKRLAVKAARHAIGINPVNAPLRPLGALGMSAPSDPLSIAVLTGKYWGPHPATLTVSFMESTPADLRARIVSHLNAWTRTGGITFAETQGTGQVRISRGPGGYWSYLGTDVLLIPRNRPTMNLQGVHDEHAGVGVSGASSGMRPGIRSASRTSTCARSWWRASTAQKAYDYFRRTQGWDRAAGRPAGAHAARRALDHGHARGPDVDHVLPVAGIDHQRRPADPRRARHQRHRLRLRRPDLSEGRTRPDDHA